MRLIAKHEVWVANVQWKGENHIVVGTLRPVFPPIYKTEVAHLHEGDTLLFTNLPKDGSNPYQTVVDEYAEHFTLEVP